MRLRPAAILAALLMAVICDTAAEGYHTIRKGETAFSISRKYGMTLEEFSRLNPQLDFADMPTGVRVEVRPKPARSQPRRLEVDVEPAESNSAAPGQAVLSAGKPAAHVRHGQKAYPGRPASKAGLGPTQLTGSIADSPESANGGQKPGQTDGLPPAARHSRLGSDSIPAYSPGNEPSSAVSLLRVIGALIFVAALAYLSLLALKGTLSRNAGGGSRRSVRVVETVALGANRTLHLVEIQGKRMLIGSTPGQMTVLSEIDGTLDEDCDSDNPGFQSVLSRLAPLHDRSRTAGKVSRLLREGAAFLQGKGSAARSLREGVDEDAT